MKLTQQEYCHGCDRTVTFTFEDTEARQIILCPNCGHEHYREIDGGTITSIRMRVGGVIRTAKPLRPLMSGPLLDGEVMPHTIDVVVEEKKVIANTPDGRAIVSGGENMFVTNRRWGRDPRQ